MTDWVGWLPCWCLVCRFQCRLSGSSVCGVMCACIDMCVCACEPWGCPLVGPLNSHGWPPGGSAVGAAASRSDGAATSIASLDCGMLANRWPTCWASVRRERFELARIPPSGNEADGEVAGGGGGERYRLSRCKRPLAAAVMARLGVPLPANERTVLLDDLAWGEIEVSGWLVAGLS